MFAIERKDLLAAIIIDATVKKDEGAMTAMRIGKRNSGRAASSSGSLKNSSAKQETSMLARANPELAIAGRREIFQLSFPPLFQLAAI